MSANVNASALTRTSGYGACRRNSAKFGRPLAHSAVDQIEKGTRRVDVDDLIALAAALGVSPTTLLMPDTAEGDMPVSATGTGELRQESCWNGCASEYHYRATPDCRLGS